MIGSRDLQGRRRTGPIIVKAVINKYSLPSKGVIAVITAATPSLMARWHSQLGRRARRFALPRPFGSLSFLANGAVVDGLIEVENLVLVTLYDEEDVAGHTSVTLAGFSARRVAWGVQWGGPDNSLFRKNLLLRPRADARGRRLDVPRAQLLELALQLDRQVDRYSRYMHRKVREGFKLPPLWAGFRKSHALKVSADGPELLAAAQRNGNLPGDLLSQGQRDYEGLVLYPLDWVSHHWPSIAAVFADLRQFPGRQVFPVSQPEQDLQGFCGAVQFDFYHDRFRTPPPVVAPPVAAVAG